MVVARGSEKGQTVAVYIRWSTEEQGQGTTLEVQRDSCRYYILSQGWEYREDYVFVDDGYSGGTLNRPGITALRKCVEDGLVNVVVVYKLDRLSRRLLDCVSLVTDEWVNRCRLCSTRESIDTDTPVGKMMFNILASFAEYERDVIRERTYSGRVKRAEQGRIASGKVPYGYTKDDSGNVVLNGWNGERFTGPAAIVRRIFEDALAGVGIRGIAVKLNAEGIRTEKGKRWTTGSLQRIISNEKYTGVYDWGKRSKIGVLTRKQDALPAIVSEEEFALVGNIRADRANRHPRELASSFALTGVLFCHKCGARMNGKTSKAQGYVNRYYQCSAVSHGGCDNALIRADVLEEVVIEHIRARYTEDAIVDEVVRRENNIQSAIQMAQQGVDVHVSMLANIERRMAKLEAEYDADEISGKFYETQSAKLEGEKERISDELTDAQRKLELLRQHNVDVELIRKHVSNVENWNNMSVERKKKLVRDVVEVIRAEQAKNGRGNRKDVPINLYISFADNSLPG